MDPRIKSEGDSLGVIRKAFTRENLGKRMIEVCDKKIAAKGPEVGLSFYAFFANKNDDPELLMDAATWWIGAHQLDHFDKAVKIKAMVEQ